MINDIDITLRKLRVHIKPRPANRRAICQHYDKLYTFLKEKGCTDYTACHISLSTLSNIFGPVKVTKVCGSLDNNR
jgi:hypothetical protein